MQLLANFKKILCMGFRAILNFRKREVSSPNIPEKKIKNTIIFVLICSQQAFTVQSSVVSHSKEEKMYFTERNTLAPTRPYLFITVINLHIFCINYLPTFDLKTGKIKIERRFKTEMKCFSGYGEKTHKRTLQKNKMQIEYYFFEKLFQTDPPNLT